MQWTLIMLARFPPVFQGAKGVRNAVTGINEVGIFPNRVLQSRNPVNFVQSLKPDGLLASHLKSNAETRPDFALKSRVPSFK